MLEKIKKVILKRCDQIVTGKTKLSEIDMDSLDKMELIMELEDLLDINIPENVLRDDTTIQELLDLRKPIENSESQKGKFRK